MKRLISKVLPFASTYVPLYLQYSETECGVACLAMILAAYGTHIPIDNLREACGVSRDGCKASTLMKVAESYGYEALAYSVDMQDLKNLCQPVIVFWNFNHYLVVTKVKSNKIYINDPAEGRKKLSLEEFDKGFTGIIIQIQPTDNVFQIKNQDKTVAKCFKSVFSHYKELLFISISLFIISCSPLINSGISSLFINYCINHNRHWLPYFASLSIISMLVLTIAIFYQKTITFRLCIKTSLQRTSEIIIHVFHLPLEFYSTRQKSTIITILSRTEIMLSQFLSNFSNFSISLFISIICLIIMINVDKYLTSIAVIASVATTLAGITITRFKFQHDKSFLNAMGRSYMHTLSSIRNIETIKIYGLESSTIQKWHNLFCAKLNLQDKVNVLTLFLESINKSSASLAMLAILFIGGSRISTGNISIGLLMGYYALYVFFTSHLAQIVNALVQVQNAYASHLRINDILLNDKDKRFTNNINQTIEIINQYTLACSNLSFHYNKMELPTLSFINLTIKNNSHIALVGRTGSGKSTLAKILCALYRADDGNVTLNKINIFDMPANELARHFSFVSQDLSLFSGTLYDNLTLWRDTTPISLINHAIQVACLEDLIASRGLYAKVEEGGNNFSGGERQRIDIARAIIQDTPILILDEATSSLDVHTEAQLIKNLRRLDKTIIFVAHRLSTISHCDQIYVLDKGKIIEHGNHDNLITKHSAYYNLLDYEKNADSM